MFTRAQFLDLYNLLSLDFLDEDCGAPCGKFCCVGDGSSDNAFKYLLPNEIELLVSFGLHNYAIFEDYGFVINYRSPLPNTCLCAELRDTRPFCCRIFPFRPLILGGRVVDISKTTNPAFTPCWITSVKEQWRERAIEAWRMVLSDVDNLLFFCRLFYCLEFAKTSDMSFAEAMSVDAQFKIGFESFASMSSEQLLSCCGAHFRTY